MSTKRFILGIIMLSVIAATVACVKSADPREIPVGALPDATATPASITFPREELSHDSRLEWWYHSGHLRSETGKEFGFHFVVFKADDGLGEPNLVAQLGILDAETGEHYHVSRAEAGIRSAGDGPLDLGIANWVYSVEERSGNHQFSAVTNDLSLSLQLEATTPVMLHNEIGWLTTETGATYYYTWPRQSAVGELIINGEKFSVTGSGWFDHQWGDFFVLGKPAGWQWFAMHLDDGGSMMITQSRGIDGKIAETYGTYMSAEGDVRHLEHDADGIDLAALGEWTSAETGGTYPSGWSLIVESLGLDLRIDPVANDQEIQGVLPAAATYWEGKARISGLQNGLPIGGDAYVELSGYVDPEPIDWMQR